MSNINTKKTWTTDDMINLGEYNNFIQICVDGELTLKALADMYGVSPRTIGRWKERWNSEIETYRKIREVDETWLSELSIDLEDWFIGKVLDEQDAAYGDLLDFKDYVEAAIGAIGEIEQFVGMDNIKLELNEPVCNKVTVSIVLDGNLLVKIFEFTEADLIALSTSEETNMEELDDADTYEPAFSYTYTLTRNSLSIDQHSYEEYLITNHCDKSNPVYQEFVSNVIQADLSEEQEQDLLAVYWRMMKPALGIESFTKGRIKVDVNSHQVIFIDDDGQEHPVVNKLTDKIIQTLDGEPAEHLIAFLDNLMNNVSKRAIDNLYSFLAFNDIKITDDGCFTAWKVVNYDYTDCYTGKIDNSPGQIVSMPRNQVDDNPEVTCSTGLHVCAAHYIPHFSGYNRRLVKVKVDPKDVISVPIDYNFAKMRVCRYEVLEEVVDFAN